MTPNLQDNGSHYQSALLEELHREHGVPAAGQVHDADVYRREIDV